MRQAIGDVLPLAIAAAISPFPIIGVVLMLVSRRARTNGPLFVVGWVVGLAGIGAIGLSVATAAGASENSTPSSGSDVFEILVGAALILLAMRHWHKRPKRDEEPPAPAWMDSVDGFGPARATAAGVALSAANPKNLLLTLAAATTIAAKGLPAGDEVVAYAVYCLIATIGVATPVVIAFALGDRSKPVLDHLKVWLARHNAAIMAVIFVVIGAKVLGQGIAG